MVMSRFVTGAVLALALALGGCGSSSSLNGTYHQAGGGGVITLEFKSGKVTINPQFEPEHLLSPRKSWS